MVEELQEKRILIIDDDPGLCRILSVMLSYEGALTFTAGNGQEGLRRFYEHRPDLVLLDLMMPELDGWRVCQQLRQLSDVPIIILSALSQEEDIVKGLHIGADDYITKPFSQPILLARSRSALRRAALPANVLETIGYEDDYLVVSLNTHQALILGEPVKLTATEYNLLAYLVQYADQIRTFAQILSNVWGEEYRGSAEYVHTYIWNLRQKIEPDPREPRYITTEHTIGYRFVSQISSP